MRVEEKVKLSREIREINNKLVVLRMEQENFKDIFASRSDIGTPLEVIYEELGLIFVDGVKRTLEDARIFHKQIMANRKDFLRDERDRVDREVNRAQARPRSAG